MDRGDVTSCPTVGVSGKVLSNHDPGSGAAWIVVVVGGVVFTVILT
jgi:hypothetical protein